MEVGYLLTIFALQWRNSGRTLAGGNFESFGELAVEDVVLNHHITTP